MIWEETFGEYGLSAILKTRLNEQEAGNSTVGWRGDVLQAYEKPGEENLVLMGYVLFENEERAGRFYDGYRKYLAEKNKSDSFIDWQDSRYQIKNPGNQRQIYLEHHGKRVMFIENVDEVHLGGVLDEIWPK